MRKYHLYLILIIALVSCGPKVLKSPENIVREVEVFVSQVDTEKALKSEVFEGALTDKEGFKDIGKFKLTYYYNAANENLQRVENIETTNAVVTENFYFKDRNLVYISTKTNAGAVKKLYVNSGNIISKTDLDANYQKILLDKSRIFQKDFKEIID